MERFTLARATGRTHERSVPHSGSSRAVGSIKALKPDPRAFTAVLDALAVRPDRTVFVDKSPANIYGATALGMPYQCAGDCDCPT